MIYLTFFNIFSLFITLLLIFIAHRLFVRPYLILAPYRKLNHVNVSIKSRLIPNLKSFYQDSITKGDYFYNWKQIIKQDPDCRAIVAVIGPILMITLIDPDLLKEFFKNRHQQQEIYEKRLGGGLLRLFLQEGLFSAEGNTWKKHRKIDSQVFHFEFVKSQVNAIRKISNDFIGKINQNEGLSIINFFQNITGEVVCRSFFGSGIASQTLNGKSFCTIIAELMNDLVLEALTRKHTIFGTYYIKYFPSNHLKKILARMEEFKQACRGIVAERKAQMEKGQFVPESEHDLLYLLLKHQQENPNENFDDNEIVHEFITFFLAGLDTTGHMLGMATYYIAKASGVKEKLREEIKSVLGAHSNEMNFDDINKLEYMMAVFNETLRLATPAPNTAARVALETHKLGDLLIPKGAVVIPSFILNFTNAKYYDNPTEFRPDRWINSSGKVMSAHPQHPFLFTPFSAGARNCIGQHMAILEAKIILVEFMKAFDFEVPEDYKLRMTRRFLYEPLDELKLNIRKI